MKLLIVQLLYFRHRYRYCKIENIRTGSWGERSYTWY